MGKFQTALGVPPETTRAELALECLRREASPIPPLVVEPSEAPVKELVRRGSEVDLFELPVMRHHALDGGPYIDMPSLGRDRTSGVYNVSYHRMEVKDRNHTGFYLSLQHMWRIFRDYEENGEECPVAAVTGHHPAFNIGACYRGPFEADELDIIGGYLREPLRLTPSETFGDRFDGARRRGDRHRGGADSRQARGRGTLRGGPRLRGTPGLPGRQPCWKCAVTRRGDAIHQSVITPDGDKPWMDLAREGAYLRRCREAVPGVTAVCKNGRHALMNVFIAMKKMSEGDPGRAAAAALSFDQCKHVFIFDDDIDVYDPTEILWALATRVQPHRQVSLITDLMRGPLIDPSMDEGIRTSAMIVDATRPLDRPFSPVSRCPEEALKRIRLEDFLPPEVVEAIPVDRTTYWS